MRPGEQDLAVLHALTEAREQHKALTDLLDFYHDLYEVQFEAKAAITGPLARDALAARWRLEGGIPQLSFEYLSLEAEDFCDLVSRIADVLGRHNPGWQNALEEHRPDELLALAREVFETWDTLTSPAVRGEGSEEDETAVHPMALAVAFALAPVLQRAAEAILPQLELTDWAHGYCPVCGGRPNFSLLEEERGARRLMCSRCNALWPYSRVGCPYCGSREKQTYYPSEDGVYRLYVCPDCDRYLKTMDLRGVFRQVHPEVERLLTVGMDLAARQEGFGDG